MSKAPSLLKLIALDEEDLAVVSAHVQDATLRPANITFKNGRVILPINRFVWELPSSKRRFFPRHERRNTALDIGRATAMRSRGINKQDEESVLSLLALEFFPAKENERSKDRLTITFAGAGELDISLDGLEVRLTDLGGAWSTRSRPRHKQA